MAWLLLILASVLSCLGQLCQKQATRLPPTGLRGRHILFWLILALALLGAGMVLWLGVLQRLPIGIAYPMLSLNFVWITLAARIIWKEPVTPRHWLGVGVIIVGILLLGASV